MKHAAKALLRPRPQLLPQQITRRYWKRSPAVLKNTLQARPDLDVPLTRVIGRTDDGGFVGWRQDEGTMAVVDAAGTDVASAPLVASTYGDPLPVWVEAWGGYGVYLQLDGAAVHAMALW